MADSRGKNLMENSPTDKASHLLKQIQNGSARAFRSLFKMYYEPLVQYAYRYVRDIQIAEDIVSDIFLKIWEKRQELTISRSATAYLYAMVRNHSLNYLKRHRLEAKELFSPDLVILSEHSADEAVQTQELKTQIEKAIAELPKRTREVFVMHRYDNLKYSEIAEILEIKIGTVETHMIRALQYLRKRLAFLLSLITVFQKI